MIRNYPTLDDLEGEGETVLLRTDINSEVVNGKVMINDKIEEHAKTIQELSERKAKTVVISHQGRVGRNDFITLEQHAALLKNFINEDITIEYVDDIIGPAARERIKKIAEGEVLLLENVRMLAEETLNRSAEEHARSIFVRKLAPLVDMYVNDAFETAHRSHASLVGFPLVLDGGIGRVMEEELNHLETVIRREEIRRPCVYVLGGSKFEDTSVLIEHLLYTGRVDHILTTGNIANLFLCVKGLLNERFFDQEHLKRAKRILERGKDKIKVPKDVAIEIEGKREEVSIHDVDPPARQQAIYDIGMETCQEYAAVLRDARTIVMKGPAGVYERKEFIAGTKKIFEAIARSAETFSLISGGDTTSALRSLGLSKDKFSYVSLAGGSLLRYLAGEKLPALEVLKKKKR